MKKVKLCLICAGLLMFLSGCGDKTELKNHLAEIQIENELPEVQITECKWLDEADDAVYEQQLAACEMYYEAYIKTKSSDYVELYKKDLKEDKIAHYCNGRRKELQKEIAYQLEENVLSMIETVEDCANVTAYIDRVNYDTVNFYDYYAEYMYADESEKEEAICDILTVFYERSNVLAFRFMEDYKIEFIDVAMNRIVENSEATESLNMYISINNELTKALNTVYGGVPSEYANTIMMANIKLARKLLEEDNDLSEEQIDSLMEQLGEPTPSPSPEPTETPTEKPTEEPIDEPTEIPDEEIIEIPMPTRKPAPVKTPTPTPVPTQVPAPTKSPVVTQPPESYIWEF